MSETKIKYEPKNQRDVEIRQADLLVMGQPNV